jgi:hypothetical protein
MRVPEEPVCIDLFRQNPVFTSLHLKSPVHVHRLWSQLDFSALPVLISTVSLRRLTTFVRLDFKVAKWAVSSLTHCSNPYQVNMFISKFMIQILHNIQNVQEGKRHHKKET